jgi:transcriptional regulator with XRE-family HTH domain
MARAREPEERAPKSLYRPENQVFLKTLRTLRKRQELTQVELAERLGRSQNYVTSAERGVIRLDGLQLRDWCHACGVDLVAWATEIEQAIASPGKSKRKEPK